MIPFVLFLTILILSLLQTAGVVVPLVLPWILVIGINFSKREALVWAFLAGLLVDFVGGNTLGISSGFYLAVITMLFLVIKFLPKRSFLLFSFLLVIFELVEQWLFVGGINAWRVLAGVGIFWIVQPFVRRLSELKRGKMAVKLREWKR